MKPILATDRMPEEGQFFLGYGPKFGAYIGGPKWEVCRMDGCVWNEGGTERSDGDMTHWLPMPDAPEVEA